LGAPCAIAEVLGADARPLAVGDALDQALLPQELQRPVDALSERIVAITSCARFSQRVSGTARR
jgi:hypothetical protein